MKKNAYAIFELRKVICSQFFLNNFELTRSDFTKYFGKHLEPSSLEIPYSLQLAHKQFNPKLKQLYWLIRKPIKLWLLNEVLIYIISLSHFGIMKFTSGEFDNPNIEVNLKRFERDYKVGLIVRQRLYGILHADFNENL